MDYEKLYNDLQKETEQMKEDNDLLIDEYESTITMLSEAVDKYKEGKEIMDKQYNDLNEKHKAMQQDLEKYKEKNMDKMKDLEVLNKQIDSLKAELEKAIESKRLLDNKIVTLENDNEHYISKLRENEFTIEDLNSKLESALEENISLQNDFDEFKQSTEEQLQRKAEELEEAKNEIISKEKALKKEISHNKKKRKKDSDKSKAKEEQQSLNESSLLKNSTSKIIMPIVNDKELYNNNNLSRLSSHSFLKKEIENISPSFLVKHNESIDFNNNNNNYNNNVTLFEVKSFSIELLRQKRRKSSKEQKGKLGEDAVENIKEILFKIQERKKVVLSQKAMINTKLDKIGIKVQ